MDWKKAICAWVLACMALCCGCSPGGNTISGQVTGPDGQPLAKARVLVRCEATGCSANAVSDSEGKFTLQRSDRFDDGEYTVVVTEWLGDDPDNPLPATIAAEYQSVNRSSLRFQVPEQLGKPLEITLKPAAR